MVINHESKSWDDPPNTCTAPNWPTEWIFCDNIFGMFHRKELPLELRMGMVRINGLFHLLINRVFFLAIAPWILTSNPNLLQHI